jgi:signal transduction histidine kinase
MIFSSLPIKGTDLAGSVLMIVFSFLCLRFAHRLKKREPNHLIWTYLLWFCYGLAGFAVSRSAGHILKQMLLMSGQVETWEVLQPFSGAVNTFMLTVVAAVTLFFERIWNIYQEILKDRQALGSAHEELLYMNQNLERLVEDRTRALALSEKQVARADRLASVGQLSAGIAHEINNPLGIILGYTQLLLRNEDSETERYADLKIIEKHVRNCKNIVESLLNFARMSKPEKEMVNICELIDEVLNFIRHQSESDHIELVRDYAPDIPPVFADEKKIKQVLVNLVMNAKYAVASKGTITLSAKYNPDSRQILIMVKDTGCGIEKKNLPKIFDPFFTTKPTGEGTGLGLAVSYGIVKNHGGDIFAESEPGKGSVFTLVLPADSEHQEMKKAAC